MLLQDQEMERIIHRLAHEIIEKAAPLEDLAVLGIRSRGAYLAQRIAKKIESATGVLPRFAHIDVTPYRDDVGIKVDPDPTHLSITVDDKTVVLVDDVINTGRTARAALELVTRLAKPRKVLVAALVDRGSRELPIRAEIVGKNFQVGESERINVLLKECDGVDRVTLIARQREES
ncbi:MAG: bifunctional pyr operon transcriptional regulator/uracil phosphoribosyltransferase PyrR [Candidatus Binatia bacterium]